MGLKEFLEELFLLAEAERCFALEEEHNQALLNHVSTNLEFSPEIATVYLVELGAKVASQDTSQGATAEQFTELLDFTIEFVAKEQHNGES